MKRLVARGVLLASLVMALGGGVAAKADAHRTVSSTRAGQIVESVYRSHCGNGASWVCNGFPTTEIVTPIGVHSWQVELHWGEIYLPTLNPRYCAVIGRVEHDYFAEVLKWEWCWG